MTFTNKAANEMKERILQKLIQLSKKRSDVSEEDLVEREEFAKELKLSEEKISLNASKSLNAILHNYGVFSVMTIDKFTHKVIRTFARELGLSIDFDVELDLESLRNNVADLLFDKIGRDEEVSRLMVNYADSNLREDKSWNFKQSLIEFSKKLFQEDSLKAIQELRTMGSQDFLDRKAKILGDRQKFEKRLISLGKEAMDLVRKEDLSVDDFVGKSQGIIAYFQQIENGRTDLRASSTAISRVAENKWAHPASTKKTIVEELAPILKKYFDKIEGVFDTQYADYLLNLELLKRINNLSLINPLLKITEELKERDNILLISDFYQKIAEIIANEPVPFIYERLGVRYEHFLLDEFQDTSHLQWINLVPLLHNSLAQGKFNLIVGDGKQAIYRWRNGEVEQFIKLPKNIHNPDRIASLREAEKTFAAEGEFISLRDNYRSALGIVDFNNRFFTHISENQDAYIQSIYASMEQFPKKNQQGYIEFQLADDNEVDWQLEYALDVVKQSLRRGYALDDICILVRRKREGSIIARYLTTKGIRVVSQDSLMVSKDLAVRFLVNVIQAFAYPRDRNFAKKSVEQYDQLLGKKNHLFELLETNIDLQRWFKNQGIEILPSQVFHSFYEYVEFLIEQFSLDLNDNIYLQFFLEQVHLFEKKNGHNIPGYIDWFTSKGKDESIKSPEGSQAVNIMTIHKAKGLQFPIVLCSFFDWDRKKKKSEKWISNPRASIPAYPLTSTKNTRKTIHAEAMEEEDLKLELDHLNLIYVAFTRAEIALFVSAHAARRASPSKDWIYPFLEKQSEQGFMEKDDSKYFVGEFHQNDSPESEKPASYSIDFLRQKMDKPRLSTKGGDQWDINDLDPKRTYGSQLHLLLSRLEKESDCILSLKLLLRKGLINKEFETRLKKDLERLFQDPHFASYFTGLKILNECGIIDAKGRKHIPDKIIFQENTILLVDFKTGEKQTAKHKKQLQEYMDLLQEIETKKIIAEIYYTETLSVISL